MARGLQSPRTEGGPWPAPHLAPGGALFSRKLQDCGLASYPETWWLQQRSKGGSGWAQGQDTPPPPSFLSWWGSGGRSPGPSRQGRLGRGARLRALRLASGLSGEGQGRAEGGQGHDGGSGRGVGARAGSGWDSKLARSPGGGSGLDRRTLTCPALRPPPGSPKGPGLGTSSAWRRRNRSSRSSRTSR